MNNNPKECKNAIELVEYWARTQPNAIYLTQPLGNGKVREYSWQAVLDEAKRMAAYLKSLDLPEQSHVAMLSKNCANWITADLAIWMAGHVSVPLYPTLTADTVEYILEHSEAKLLFVGKLDDWDSMKGGIPEALPCVAFDLAPEEAKGKYLSWEKIVGEHQALAEVHQPQEDDLATIVYTSGSTGKPKGVMLTFKSMKLAAEGVVNSLAISPQERMLSYLPLSHVFERFVVEMGSLNGGFQLFFAESLDTFLQDLNRARPTLFMSIPRIWQKFQSGIFAKMPKQKLDRAFKVPLLNRFIKKKILKTLGLEHVRYAGSGSAPLSADTIGWYRSLGLELLEGYGMSENFAYSHMTQPGRSRLGYVGEVLPGVECRIANDGEIQVKGPTMMSGYFKDNDKTAEAFTEDGYLRTGDRGELDQEGRLKITGRTKEIFKTSKGKYVAPAPIENKLIAHPQVEAVCVAGNECPQPHALLMLSEDAYKNRQDEGFRTQLNDELQSLIKEVNSTLDPHENLDFVVVVEDQWSIENGFLTPTMKLKRDVVEDAYQGHISDWYGHKQKVIFQ